MDNNNRPKIIMKSFVNSLTDELGALIDEAHDASPKPVAPANKPPIPPASIQIPQVDTNSPLAKGLPTSWSVDPPEMPIRRKGVK